MGQTRDPSSLMRQIDENLRRVYREDSKNDDEIPDKFMQLLQKLKEQDSGNGK